MEGRVRVKEKRAKERRYNRWRRRNIGGEGEEAHTEGRKRDVEREEERERDHEMLL